MLPPNRFPLLGLLLAAFLAATIAASSRNSATATQNTSVHDPNASCAPCHREIYERYRQTPMAKASGPATDGFIPADFVHAASGLHYRVTAEWGRVWLNYLREPASADRALDGRQELRYFIGSGKRGRTYLFEQQGYWFEAPINWYGKKQMWDMAPNHANDKEMPLTMPVDPGCLHCHASAVERSLPDARNHYEAEPFAYGGITCEACHGDGSTHIATGGKTPLLNIDALEAVRRDSVCLNCHLEGQAAVVRQGKALLNFAPGDDLFDYALFFVYKSESGSGGRATSQWEALLRSQCKQKSGDRMTCTTCHDPHGSPAAAEKVAFYRQRCLQCHNQSSFAEQHHPENPDCTACHMARPPSNDIAHEQVTDHWIRRQITNERLPLASTGELVSVGGFAADDRDLGLAYAQMAARGNQAAGIRAMELLQRAEATRSGARDDHELHAQLGFLKQMNGQIDAAVAEYKLALEADANDSLAAGDLAIIEASEHHYDDAVHLWNSVFAHDPAQLAAGMNLAVVECGLGQKVDTLATLERLLKFAPDNGNARTFAERVRSGKQNCGEKQP